MDATDLDDLTPDPEAIALMPEAIARTLRCIPIAASARTLKLAVATPLSGDQLRSLTGITQRQLIYQIEPGPHLVDDLIEDAYGGSGSASDSASAA